MIDLKTVSTLPPDDLDKAAIKKLTVEMQQEILQLQTLLLANKKIRCWLYYKEWMPVEKMVSSEMFLQA